MIRRNADLVFADLPGRRAADPLAGVPAASSIRIVELGRSPARTAHRHPHSEEVVYVESGTGSVWIEGTEHRVEAGDLVHVPAGAAHATVPDEGVLMRLVCFFPHPDLTANTTETDIVVS